jgi:hypothetical protein
MNLESQHDITDRVIIDQDASIVGTVTAILWRGPHRPTHYEVSWIANGDSKACWIEEFRLSKVEPHERST